MVTEVSSTQLDQDSRKWDPAEIDYFVKKGICVKVEATERLGIQPYWLKDVETGAMEELRRQLGKWSSVHQGYLLGFHRPTLVPDVGLQGRHPYPVVYFTFNITRYIYQPSEGQRLKGIINQFGKNAASCTVLGRFVGTVYPSTEEEFNSWNIGDDIKFWVTSFEKLYRGVLIQGSTVKKTKKRKRESLPVEGLTTEPEPAEEEHNDQDISEAAETEITDSPKRKRRKANKE